jgi:intraflagellar transport protein 140
MQELRTRSPSVNMAYFVNVSVIESIHRALGIPMGRGLGAEGAEEVEDDLHV